MTTVKVKFKPSSLNRKEGVLYYQLINNRDVRLIKTEYRIYSDEWNAATSELIIPSFDKERKKFLIAINANMNRDLKCLSAMMAGDNRKSLSYHLNEIVSRTDSTQSRKSFFRFMKEIIARHKQLGKDRISETYLSTLNSFSRFRLNRDIMLDRIDSDLLMSYEAYLKSEQVCMNTISFYMRVLRAVYNRAVEKGLIEQRHPFKHVYTGIDKTVKRSVNIGTIKKIKMLDLTLFPTLEYVRDLFMFSFYARGMSFVDMAYLRKRDLNNGILSYRRKKTGRQLYIRWESCMQEIIDKYPCKDTPYLLPIISSTDKDERRQYRSANAFVTRKLKEIQRMLRLDTPLTMYVTRHSWASIAKSKNVPVAVISESMGHDSEATTQIYLASLSSDVIDRANLSILTDVYGDIK